MFKFKKIASVLTSAIMISSTVALAAAANYPAPFVNGGAANVAVVYGGSDAATTDLVAASDVSTSLSNALTSQSTGVATTGTSVAGGDFVKLEKSSDKMNLGDSMSGVFGTTVDKGDLEVLLADGTYLNDENTEYDYDQKLTLIPRNLTYFADSDYKDKEPTVGFQLSSGVTLLNYTLDLTTDAESDVVSGDLADFETTDINILGKKFYILDAQNGTDANYLGKFTLLDAANTAIITEGETQTVSIGDKKYDVSINFVSSTSAKIEVNGEVTNSLATGETFKLSDGTYVGIKDILYNSKDTGISKVEISIGSGKLEMTAGSEIELNDETVDGVSGWFERGTPASDGTQRLDKIVIQWETDDEEFIAPGSDLVMPGVGGIKFSSGGFVVSSPEVTEVNYDGDDTVELRAPIRDGLASINILGANATGEFTLIGKDTDERLATSGTSTLWYNQTVASNNYHKYFVVTYNTTDDGESYLLSATVNEDNSAGRNTTTIKNEITGKEVCTDEIATGVCDIGDASITISQISKTATAKGVTFTAGTNTNFNTVFTEGGLKIYLPWESANTTTAKGSINFTDNVTASHNLNSYALYFDEEDKDDNKGAGTSFNVTVNDDSDGDVQVSDIDTAQTEHEIPGTSDDLTTRVKSDLATQIDYLVASDRGKAKITYSGSQAYADVFLTAPSASIGGGSTVTSIVPIMDSEVSGASGKNLIVVGGSCVNSVAASLLGSSTALCGDGFTASTGVASGQFLIQTFSRDGGNVATLVAGYNAGDTTNAATYLRTQAVDTTVGKKYKGTSATSAESMVA